MRQLPDLFLAEMRALFERFDQTAQWPDFYRALQDAATGGQRANGLKIAPVQLQHYLAGQTGFDI